jgi:hypothetical protein
MGVFPIEVWVEPGFQAKRWLPIIGLGNEAGWLLFCGLFCVCLFLHSIEEQWKKRI